MSLYPKELSWLAFNERVLQEAADSRVPIIERVHFLGIFSNNADEFFSVRVAEVRRKVADACNKQQRRAAEALFADIQQKVVEQQTLFDSINLEVRRELAKKHMMLIEEEQITTKEKEWLKGFFHSDIKRFLVPLLIGESTSITDIVNEDSTYFFVELMHQGHASYAAVELPRDRLPRFIKLPFKYEKRNKRIVLLDSVITLCLEELFDGIVPFDTVRAHEFKLTRDAEYRLSHDIEHSVLELMEEGIRQREQAEAVRLVYDGGMPQSMLDFLVDNTQMAPNDSLVAGGRYRNTRDFVSFPNWGRKSYQHPPVQALNHPVFMAHRNVFAAIASQDILLYYPYHRFEQLTELVRQAAYDPAVRSINICLYRVASNSQIIESLVDAARNGKKVTVMVELQARFDEEANIEWAKFLTQEGVRVIFGIQGLKVHAKLILITRKEDQGIKRYCHIGTGNFNEKTARIYTDFSLFTADDEINADVERVFQYLEKPYQVPTFTHLLVSPVSTRTGLMALIEGEIEAAERGKKAEIFLKINNLVDEGLIHALERASQAGVSVRAIVRGMCCLRPGVKGISDNIEVRSIVDRFLEHARVFCFHNHGDPRTYISSADWYGRNLDQRVEVSAPLNSPAIAAQVKDILEIQWRDNTKARIIDASQSNTYQPRGNRKKVRSQMLIYDYLKQAGGTA
ncbi:polyphosphate kinase 1 [Carnimonas bestiolae]|uniref:polyphosphate kinase 1 n=1 Tax=Carnimonas bestiolae TaxID=3402172 RepID=UPI003EDC4F44